MPWWDELSVYYYTTTCTILERSSCVSGGCLLHLEFLYNRYGKLRSPSHDTMRAPMMLNIQSLIDDAKCFETVRHMRWPDGITCPHCTSLQVTRQGFDETRPMRQKYECRACRKRFDDLTGTIFAGHHRPLRTWILGLYFMGLNLSNEQIAKELDLNGDHAQKMTSQLRRGIVERTTGGAAQRRGRVRRSLCHGRT